MVKLEMWERNKNSYKGVLHRLIKVAKCLADLLHTLFTYAKVT